MAGVGLAGREGGGARPEPGRESYRTVRAIGLLLMLEAAGIAAYGAYEFSRVEWRRIASAREAPPPELLSALGFLVLRRRGWLLAAISQGLVVATALWLYAEYEPPYVFPVMAYAGLMILYLNVHDVRAVFYPGSRKGSPSGPRRMA